MDLNGKKILIENDAGLGDNIMFTPTLRAIKEMYPQCELSFLVKPVSAENIRGISYIDHVYETGGFLGDYSLLPVILKQDVLICTTWQPQIIRMAYCLGVKYRVSRYKQKYENTSLAHKWIKPTDSKDINRTDIIAREIGEALGIELRITDQTDLAPYETTDKQLVDDWLGNAKDNYVVIAPFSTRKDKDIPYDLLRKIISYITKECQAMCVVVGRAKQPGDEELENCIDLRGKTTLPQLKCLIANSDYVISADSGPMHMSCALRKKTIAIFTRYSPKAWAPKTFCYPVSANVDCIHCDNGYADQCKNKICRDRLTFDMVLEKINLIDK